MAYPEVRWLTEARLTLGRPRLTPGPIRMSPLRGSWVVLGAVPRLTPGPIGMSPLRGSQNPHWRISANILQSCDSSQVYPGEARDPNARPTSPGGTTFLQARRQPGYTFPTRPASPGGATFL